VERELRDNRSRGTFPHLISSWGREKEPTCSLSLSPAYSVRERERKTANCPAAKNGEEGSKRRGGSINARERASLSCERACLSTRR